MKQKKEIRKVDAHIGHKKAFKEWVLIITVRGEVTMVPITKGKAEWFLDNGLTLEG